MAYVTGQYFGGASRNWAYPAQLEQLLIELVDPLEGRVQTALGFKLVPVIRLWRWLRDRIFARLGAFHSLRATLGKIPLADQDIARLRGLGIHELLDDVDENDPLERQHFAVTTKAACLYTFTLDEAVSGCAGLDAASLDIYLSNHAIEPRTLGAYQLEDTLLENPVWERPVIKVGSSFFVPLPSLFHSFAFRHLELLYKHMGMERAYSDRRAKFLENKIVGLFKSALPSAEFFANSKFTHSGRDGENDLLIRCGNWMIVVEAKSNKVSRPAQRGGISRLESEIKELMIKPSEQSASFAACLVAKLGIREFQTDATPNVVDTSETVRILRLSVSLEPLGPIATQPNALNDIRLVDPNFRWAVTMHVMDLATVLSTLESEEERLDYLFRRADGQREAPRVDGQETDLLMFYIANGLRASWSVSKMGGHLSVAGWNRILDDEYLGPLEGKASLRTRRAYSPFWRQLVAAARAKGPLFWPEATTVLLTLGKEEQLDIERQLRRSASNPEEIVGRKIFAAGWGETFLIAFKVVTARNRDVMLVKLRDSVLAELRQKSGDHALIVLFQGQKLEPVEIVILTNHQRPRWM